MTAATGERPPVSIITGYLGAGIGNLQMTTDKGEQMRVYFYSGEDPGYTGYFAWIPRIDATLVLALEHRLRLHEQL